MKKIFLIKIYTIVFSIILSCGILAENNVYSIIISPVLINDSNILYIETLNKNNISEYEFVYGTDSPVIFIATVTRNGIPVKNAQLLWQIRNISDKSNALFMKHKSIIKEYYDKNFITATASETKKISVQYPYKTKNTFYGSGLEKEILISEGQSYIFINSQNTAEYEINATLLSNTKISDKITAVFKKKTRAELSLYHYDNGPVKFSYDELNSNNYSLLSSEITSKKGFPFNDYLVIALPENWTFLYPERKNFIKNFSLAINSKEISEKYLEQNSEIISGTVKDNSVQRNYAAVKLNIKPGYSYKFTVKSRPSEKANPSDESKIYSSNSFLLNHKLSAVNPLTLIKGEKKELSHEFSDLNIFFNSLNENNSELVLKNNGNGTIKILNTAVNYLNNINDNRIFIRPDSVQEGKFYNNYLQNPFEFILTGKESEAKIIFSRKNVYKSVPDFYITYEISRIDSTGKKISSIDTLIFSQNSGNTE